MPAKLRQVRQLLGHRHLHVMAGNPLVIGGRLIVDEGAMREVGSGDNDPARPRAIRRSGLVVGRRRRLESRYGFHGYGRAGNIGEELRQLALHLGEVLAIVIDESARRRSECTWDSFQGSVERGQIRKALLLCNRQHLGLDTSSSRAAQAGESGQA